MVRRIHSRSWGPRHRKPWWLLWRCSGCCQDPPPPSSRGSGCGVTKALSSGLPCSQTQIFHDSRGDPTAEVYERVPLLGALCYPLLSAQSSFPRLKWVVQVCCPFPYCQGTCDRWTHITGQAFIIFHQVLILLVHSQHLADPVGGSLSLE